MQNNNTVRVRIVKCRSEKYWYNNLVDTEIVVEHEGEVFYGFNDGLDVRQILKSDCVVLPSEQSLTAKEWLLKTVPVDCYWKEADHLVNTPIHYIIEAMEMFAASRPSPEASANIAMSGDFKIEDVLLPEASEQGKGEDNQELTAICLWISQQPEYKILPITSPISLFYHVAPAAYAKFILRFAQERPFEVQPRIQDKGKRTLQYQVADAFGDWKDVTYDVYDEYPSSHPRRIITLRNGEEVHPEDYCDLCDSCNPVWFAPNELWKAVMGRREGILCPMCFMAKGKEVGLDIIFKAISPWIKEEMVALKEITELQIKNREQRMWLMRMNKLLDRCHVRLTKLQEGYSDNWSDYVHEDVKKLLEDITNAILKKP